jgi:aubergine-like protein
MIGHSIIADYGNNRIYRIDEIMFDMNPLSTFQDRDGNKITYKDYFKKAYGKVINNVKQPLFAYDDKRTKQRIFLVPELVHMTGLTDDQRNNFKLMKEMAVYTKLEP